MDSKHDRGSGQAQQGNSLFDSLIDFLMLEIESFFTLKKMNSLLESIGITFEEADDETFIETTIDMLNSRETTHEEGTLGYSVSSDKEVFHSEFDAGKHTAVVGASGFGKTTLAFNFIERDLKSGIPFIFKDPKTSVENIDLLISLSRRFDRNCYIIAESSKTTLKFDVFHNLNATQVTMLIVRSINWSNEYYQNESTSALYKASVHLIENEIKVTFRFLYSALKALFPDSDTISSLVTFLEILIDSELGKLFDVNEEEPGVSLMQIRTEGSCCYFGLSIQGYGTLSKRVGKIITGVFLQHSHHVSLHRFKGVDPRLNPISIHEDEHGSTITFDSVELLNKARSSGIQIYSYTQTFADYESLSKEVKKQVLENSNNLFIQKQSCPDEVRYLADFINTIDDEKHTKVVMEEVVQEMGSVRDAKKYIVHPNLFPKLRNGQAIWVSHDPKRLEIINIREIKLLQTENTLSLSQDKVSSSPDNGKAIENLPLKENFDDSNENNFEEEDFSRNFELHRPLVNENQNCSKASSSKIDRDEENQFFEEF